MKFILTVMATFYTLALVAQTNENLNLELSAIVVDTADQAIPFVTVTNLTYHTGAVTDEEGFFFIRFGKEDTLEISAVGYEKQQLYFGDTATASYHELVVTLSEKTYALENVTVFAYKDEYAFKKALLALDESDLPKAPSKISIPGAYNGPRTEKRPSIVRSPVSFLFDRLSRHAKEERKAQEVAQEYEYRKTLDKKYNKDMIGKITGLKDNKLDEFMAYCRLEDAFVEKSNNYEIIVAINRCYENFQMNRH